MVASSGPPAPSERDGYGFAWDVYPRISSRPMVAQGHSSTQDKARAAVEQALGDEDTAAWGVVISPWGKTEVCRRNGEGGFAWRPLFPEAPGGRE